jgi:hypothetical protein
MMAAPAAKKTAIPTVMTHNGFGVGGLIFTGARIF